MSIFVNLHRILRLVLQLADYQPVMFEPFDARLLFHMETAQPGSSVLRSHGESRPANGVRVPLGDVNKKPDPMAACTVGN